MADITLNSLKASLRAYQSELDLKITELNNAKNSLSGYTNDNVINDILINGYTIPQYFDVHPPAPFNESYQFANSPARVQNAANAIGLQRQTIPALETRIAFLNSEIARLTTAIGAFSTQQVKETLATAVKTVTDTVKNNLPGLVATIIIIALGIYGIRYYFKNRKPKAA